MKIEGACHPVISVCPFKLQNRIFKRIFSSKGAKKFCGELRLHFLPLPPLEIILPHIFPPKIQVLVPPLLLWGSSPVEINL